MNAPAYQICTHCVMDTTDPEITFDDQGVCNHCHDFEHHQKPQLLGGAAGDAALARLVSQIKADGKRKQYDCIIGISGGVDSSYVAYRVLQLGLRPLAVHVDTGWNSELAVGNIEKIVSALNIDLHTTVIDWDEMRDLQLAFLRSGVANCDVPQDHTFVAVLFKLAARSLVCVVCPSCFWGGSVGRYRRHGPRPPSVLQRVHQLVLLAWGLRVSVLWGCSDPRSVSAFPAAIGCVFQTI